MKFACCILTTPSRHDCLTETRVSVEEAGFRPEDILLVSDGDTAGVTASCQWQNRSGSPYRGYMRALAALLSTDADALVLFEDDVLVARHLKDYLRDSLWPDYEEDTLCVSLYMAASFAEKHVKDQRGFVSVEPWLIDENRDALGVCAMVYTRWGAASVLQHLGRENRQHGQGAAIVRLMRHIERPCLRSLPAWWTHSPSLVQHVGTRSTFHDFGLDDNRQAGDWVQDCRELLP